MHINPPDPEKHPGAPKYTHLENAIRYILDEKKTCGGVYAGGNSGTETKEILSNFLDTKEAFEKPDGRQGYHFVISFAKGETDAQTAYKVVEEFCREYLGDAYDHVFAIHTDKEHLHGHIIFNSVNRGNGYKYHYKKGDWERHIQPVTDKICEKYGLEPLTYEEERAGVSYASWAYQKCGRISKSLILKADIDLCIKKSKSVPEFLRNMEAMGYSARLGYSRKNEKPYLTFIHRNEKGEKDFVRRSYALKDPAYDLEGIAERIKTKEGPEADKELAGLFLEKTAGLSFSSARMKSQPLVRRLYQAVSYYTLPNPYAVPSGRVRSDMLHLEQLIADCRYMKEENLTNREAVCRKASFLEQRIRRLKKDVYVMQELLDSLDGETVRILEEYRHAAAALAGIRDGSDDSWEEIEERMDALRRQMPEGLAEMEERLSACRHELKDLYRQKKTVKRLMEASLEAGAPALKKGMPEPER